MNIAVFTIAKNEKYFLPIWLNYYRKYFSDNDIYVLDNNTDDGSTTGLSCNVIKTGESESFDAEFLRRTVQNFQVELFKNYDYVLFAESDEIVYPVFVNNFFDYIKNTDHQDVYRCFGYEVIHQFKTEPDLDFNKPILAQRNKWYVSKRFCKPLLSRVPLQWCIGFHTCKNMSIISHDLLMVHLHRVDFKTSMARNSERINNLCQHAVEKKWGWQNFIQNETDMKKFFKTLSSPMTGLHEIPAIFKGVI